MAVRNFFSGVEGKQHYEACVQAGAKHVLTSYLQFFEKGDLDFVKRRKLANPEIHIMVDSGAHTFLTNHQKFASWTRKKFDEYAEGYAKWLHDNRQYLFAAVELDLDYALNMILGGGVANSTFGTNIVESWQRNLFMPLERKGLPICYVWHTQRRLEGWEEMCSKFGYVGLPGGMSSDSDFNKYMTVARRYCTRVHGFAASVTGDSKVQVRNLVTGEISSPTIKELFDSCERQEETLPGEHYGYLSQEHQTWSLTDDLKSAYEGLAAVVRHRLKKPLYRIRLRGGKTVTGTGDHSFFSLDSFGGLVEVQPSNLKKGDHLVASLGAPLLKGSDYAEEDMEFFGLWFGDGHVGLRDDGQPSSIWVSGQHHQAVTRCCEQFAARSGSRFSLVPGTVDGYMTSIDLAKWLVANFGRVGPEKFIGPCLLSASRKSKAAFLRGYFSADGCAKGTNRLVSLGCCRRDLLEAVQLLLEEWDIRSGISDAGLSGLGFPQWELAISDVRSREIFAEEIGFLQAEQNKALSAKNGTKAVAGCHRGLPVALLQEPGFLWSRKGQGLRRRPVYAKDRRTALHPQNFCARLREMQCEYLEIEQIELVSNEEVEVYDLSVPTTERFFANGILAHNTKQSDFRDWPWFSIDSITWKTSEMYGTLIHWDGHNQKLVYEEDKAARSQYRSHFLKHGLDADGIIADTAYKEVTKYALISMRSMEQHYEQKFASRTFYYELRLPMPDYCLKGMPSKEVWATWTKLRPAELFKQDAGEKSEFKVRQFLAALSAVQNRLDSVITSSTPVREFLERSFPRLALPNLADPVVFQKELASYIMPPNPPALQRVDLEHYTPTNNPPKSRGTAMYELDQLEVDPARELPIPSILLG